MKKISFLAIFMILSLNIPLPSFAQNVVGAEQKKVLKKRYREIKAGELFIDCVDEKEYKLIAWKTKRPGLHAFDENDQPMKPRFFPVFAQKEEVKEWCLKYDKNLDMYYKLLSKTEPDVQMLVSKQKTE